MSAASSSLCLVATPTVPFQSIFASITQNGEVPLVTVGNSVKTDLYPGRTEVSLYYIPTPEPLVVHPFIESVFIPFSQATAESVLSQVTAESALSQATVDFDLSATPTATNETSNGTFEILLTIPMTTAATGTKVAKMTTRTLQAVMTPTVFFDDENSMQYDESNAGIVRVTWAAVIMAVMVMVLSLSL